MNATSRIISVCRLFIGIAFLVLIAAVVTQVLGRTVFDDSPVWTEELTRYALLFLAAFGAGLSYRTGDMVNVDLIHSYLPLKWARYLKMLSAAATAGLSLLLLAPAWKFTAIGAMQTSPALGWPKNYIHVSVSILIFLLFVFSLLHLLELWQNKIQNPPNSQNSTEEKS